MKAQGLGLIRKLKFSWLLSIVIGVFAVVPLSVLMWYAVYSQQTRTIEARMQELEIQRSQQIAQEEKMSELCNMVSQVFLNTAPLKTYLSEVKRGETHTTEEMLSFYRTDVGGLEKVVVGNPYLYQVRVYSDADGINEMLPILYSHNRMDALPWGKSYVSGTWQLDFTETQIASRIQVPHVMALVTDIQDSQAGHVGTLEVSVRMEEIFPTLFEQNEERQTFLIGSDGSIYGNAVPGADADELRELAAQPEVLEGTVRTTFGGEDVLAAGFACTDIGCTYLQISSLEPLQQSVRNDWITLSLLILGIFVLLIIVASMLVHRLLRGFYQVLEGINAFSQGNLDARVKENDGQDEVRQFAHGVNHMLDSICELMRENLARQRSAQTAQMRALQNQINAHFIYNVLEAIKMMAEIDEKYEIADAVTNLGKLLRYGMKWVDKNVTVQQEIEYIQNYIALMNLRFDYTITLLLDVPEELMQQQIPKMSLQPIVENAVVHGAAVLSQDTEILICASHDADKCIIEIVDHGKGITPEKLEQLEKEIAGEIVVTGKSGNGIGLRNVQERMEMAFGPQYGLSVDSELSHFTRVMVTLPYCLEEKIHENGINR